MLKCTEKKFSFQHDNQERKLFYTVTKTVRNDGNGNLGRND